MKLMMEAVGGGSMANGEKTLQTEKIALSIEEAVTKVRTALTQIRYGEVIVKVEGGKPIWVDRHERERVG